MYRWDRLNYLYSCHENAMKNNYLLGFKIVRGAYMEKERKMLFSIKGSTVENLLMDPERDPLVETRGQLIETR